MTTPRYGGAENAVYTILQGMHLHSTPPERFAVNDALLETHVLFLGSINTGKTNGMKQIVRQLRAKSRPDDVFIFFDTKGDFLRDFRRAGDAVISSDPDADPNGVRWNLFRDLPADPRQRAEEIDEIATTIFSDELDQAGPNRFFAAAASEIFAAVVAALADQPNSNAELRATLGRSADELYGLLNGQPGLSGTARYLESGEATANSILSFLQQTLRRSFSGVFRESGDFSVRDFVGGRGGRALFVEYDIAVGSSLLPIYRVLIDLAIKEALGFGRRRLADHDSVPDNFYFVLDEFALLPRLSHIGDGINFGRELGLRFLVATQNVNQVLGGYSRELGESILSGFGTVFAFRLTDEASRTLLRQRYGTNRKKFATTASVRHEGVQETVVVGNVIEDGEMSGLVKGQCIAALPQGPPFLLRFAKFKRS